MPVRAIALPASLSHSPLYVSDFPGRELRAEHLHEVHRAAAGHVRARRQVHDVRTHLHDEQEGEEGVGKDASKH